MIALTLASTARAQTAPAPAAPQPASPAAAQPAQPATQPATPTATQPAQPATQPATQPAQTATQPPQGPAAQPAAAEAQPVPMAAPLEPGLAALLAEQRDALGRRCQVRAVLASGELRYVACGEAGVWIVRMREGAPATTVERRDVEGEAIAFFVQSGRLWVQIASVQARPLLQLDGQAPALAPAMPQPPDFQQTPASPPPPAPAPKALTEYERPPRDALVVENGPGYVVIDLGSYDGIRDGDHVAFYERVHDLVGDDVSAVRHELLAVGKVDSVAPGRARVQLGLDERVPAGSIAQRTDRALTAVSVAPPRLPGLWDVAFVARPFLVLENLGAGLFADVRAGYRSESGLHYEALLSPLAVATADQGTTLPAAAVFAVSYDARLFEVGLGVGGQTLNDTPFDLEPGSGITLLQRVRLGARDGLHIEGLSYVALFHSQFEFSSLRIQAQIPLSRGTWMLAGGSGGSLGLGHGEVGLRVLLHGNGDRDSFFLTTTIGGVHVFEDNNCLDPFAACEPPIDYTGLLVGAGGEWRL